MGYIILIAEVIFIIICIFAIFLYPHFKKIKKTTPYYTILAVKDSEESIEGIVRSIIKRLRKYYPLQQSLKILIIDTGSTDSTPLILEKLSKNQPSVEFYTIQDILFK